jgi:hypothetical protein
MPLRHLYRHRHDRAPALRVSRALRPAAVLAAALAAAGCAPSLYRDPTPRFPARRSHLVEATVGAPDTVAGHLVEPVRLRAASGLTVELLLKRPLAAAGARRAAGGPSAGEDSAAAGDAAHVAARAPVVLLLGGHHAGRAAANIIPDTRGMAVAALSYPYTGKHRLSAFGAVRAAPSIRRALLDTPPAIQLALDWLLAQPWADSSRVEGVGASLGVPFMTVAAAIDPRITRLWSVHGAGDAYRLLAHNTRRHVRLKPLRSLTVRAAHRASAAEYLTPERWVARVSPRPFVMINATDDERLPREAVLALYDSARAPKELVWLPGKHVQRNRPEIVRALVATVLERMER